MLNCGAFGCTNRSSHNKELTFHQIPGEGRNKQLRKMWLTNIRRAGELPKDKSFYISSEHFAEDCYERDFKLLDAACASTSPNDLDETIAKSVSIQTESEKFLEKSVGYTVNMVHKKVGTFTTMVSVGTQCCDRQSSTGPERRDVAVNTEEMAGFDDSTAYVPSCSESGGETDSFKDANFSFHSDENESFTEASDETDDEELGNEQPSHDTKFVVFWSCLLPLLQICSTCFTTMTLRKIIRSGVMVKVERICSNSHKTSWYSTPRIRGMSLGNLELSASILYTGSIFTRIQEMMSLCNISFLGRTSYHAIQKQILFPTVNDFYENARKQPISLVDGPVALAGDGRCDSPGFSAKYGTYTVMDTNTMKILDFSVVHVGTVSSSNAMEKQGLKNCLQALENQGMSVASLTTDRHQQIKAYMKNEKSNINHQFDIWHDKFLLRDLRYLTEFSHTVQIEVYHSLYNKYCPKRLHFGFEGMIARSELAVLEHNAGTECRHAKTREDEYRHKLSFSKVTQNWVVKKIPEKKDKPYLRELMTKTLEAREEKKAPKSITPGSVPQYLASKEKPDKAEAVKNKRTRFET
eukprot:gene16153-7518_t